MDDDNIRRTGIRVKTTRRQPVELKIKPRYTSNKQHSIHLPRQQQQLSKRLSAALNAHSCAKQMSGGGWSFTERTTCQI